MKIFHLAYNKEELDSVLNSPTTLHGHIIIYEGNIKMKSQNYIVIKCMKQLTPNEAEGIIVEDDDVFTNRNDADSLFLDENNSLTDGDIIEIKSKVVH